MRKKREMKASVGLRRKIFPKGKEKGHQRKKSKEKKITGGLIKLEVQHQVNRISGTNNWERGERRTRTQSHQTPFPK